MLNLILQKDRKKIRGEYFSRYFNLLLSFLLVILLILATLLFSIYTIVFSEEKISASNLESVINQENINTRNQLKELVSTVRKDMRFFGGEEVSYSSLIAKIVELQPENLNINSLSFNKVEKGIEIGIAGVANTRESLVIFTNSLKNIPEFGEAELPLSNLTKDSEISFDLKIDMKGFNIQDIYEEEN